MSGIHTGLGLQDYGEECVSHARGKVIPCSTRKINSWGNQYSLKDLVIKGHYLKNVLIVYKFTELCSYYRVIL
jgi:hypothetical protein